MVAPRSCKLGDIDVDVKVIVAGNDTEDAAGPEFVLPSASIVPKLNTLL